MQRIGIMGAMPEEIALLKEHLVVTTTEVVGQREYLLGRLWGQEVVLVYSRIGKVAAASTATTLIDRYKVNAILFTGVAGAVSSELEIGDVVIGTSLLQHDIDCSPGGNFKKFEVPLLNMIHFTSRDEISTHAHKLCDEFMKNELHGVVTPSALAEFQITVPKVVRGTIGSGDQFIACPQKLAELREEIPGLLCTEMEGAALAQVCHEYDVPFLVLRTISDKADHNAALDYPRFVREVASPLTAALIKAVLAPKSGESIVEKMKPRVLNGLHLEEMKETFL